jgi:hypothetical protein
MAKIAQKNWSDKKGYYCIKVESNTGGFTLAKKKLVYDTYLKDFKSKC